MRTWFMGAVLLGVGVALVGCSGVTPTIRVGYLYTAIEDTYRYKTTVEYDDQGLVRSTSTTADDITRSGIGYGGALELRFAENGMIVTPCGLIQYIVGSYEYDIGDDYLLDTNTLSSSTDSWRDLRRGRHRQGVQLTSLA